MSQIKPTELTATLLRRIAHAVDGFRSGHLVYVVVDTRRPYRVKKILRKKSSDTVAQVEKRLNALCRKSGRGYRWAGPYQTWLGTDDPWTIECHEFDSDPCWEATVTGATINPPSSPLPKPTDVQELVVEWKTRSGAGGGRRVFRWEELCDRNVIDPEHDDYDPELVPHMVDALFFTQAASDKFLIPYIARVHGVRAAFEHRSRMQHAVEEAFETRERDKREARGRGKNAKGIEIRPELKKVNKLDRERGRAVMVDRYGNIIDQDDLDDWDIREPSDSAKSAQ